MTRKRGPLLIALALVNGLTFSLLASPLPAQVDPPPAFSKVVVIILENTQFDQIIGNPDAPFFNELAGQYGLAVNYFAIAHPSLPDYLATIGGDTFGITEDCEDLNVCNRPEPFPSNLVDQIEASGRTWVAYMEDMPETCYIGSTDLYAQKHNPFIYFDTIRLSPERCANMQPYDPAGPLADFTWITPNLCDDMHDCDIPTGDAWLQSVVPTILAQPDFQTGGSGVLFITFDEDDGFGQNRVATLVIGPLVKQGYQSTVRQTHYSLLRTMEESWGLPLLGHAGDGDVNNMADFFVGANASGDKNGGQFASGVTGSR
jgi:acid phosphatase